MLFPFPTIPENIISPSYGLPENGQVLGNFSMILHSNFRFSTGRSKVLDDLREFTCLAIRMCKYHCRLLILGIIIIMNVGSNHFRTADKTLTNSMLET